VNKIHYIVFDPGSNKLRLGFATAVDAEEFLASQSNNPEWQNQWKLERVLAYNKFHYQLTTSDYMSMTFRMFP